MDLLICFLNFGLFTSQLAREAVFFRQARYGFDFQIFGAREDRKAREEVIAVADEHTTTWSTYTPCNRRSVTLAEKFMVRIQSCDGNDDPICVGLVVGVNAKKEAPRVCFGSQHLEQNSLWRLVGADLVNHAVGVPILLR